MSPLESTPMSRLVAASCRTSIALCLGGLAATAALAQSQPVQQPASTFIDSPATVRTLQFGNPTLGLPLTARTRLVYEPRPVRPWADTNAISSGAPAEARLGLEFKTISPTTGAKNLLRVQLAGGGALQFRPRGGGLTMAYRTQF